MLKEFWNYSKWMMHYKVVHWWCSFKLAWLWWVQFHFSASVNGSGNCYLSRYVSWDWSGVIFWQNSMILPTINGGRKQQCLLLTHESEIRKHIEVHEINVQLVAIVTDGAQNMVDAHFVIHCAAKSHFWGYLGMLPLLVSCKSPWSGEKKKYLE